MLIKSLPKVDRPQEKLFRYNNPSRLTNEELLAIILRTGTPGQNILQLSKKISSYIFHPNSKISLEKLKGIKGIGPTKKAQIISLLEIADRINDTQTTATLKSPKDVWIDMKDIRGSRKEHFVGYYLDIKNSIIGREVISVGTLSSSLVHPREVFEPAIRMSSARVLLSHNHPSGDPQPSPQDIQATNRLKQAGVLLDIEVLDHVIVTSHSFVSMHEKGFIENA